MQTQFENRIDTEDNNHHDNLTARIPQSGPEGAEKLDKVRDILFGNEFRSIDHRLAKMDEASARQASELRAEFRAHFKSLEEALKTLSDDVAATAHELRRDKADKLGMAELFEALAHRLREDQESMTH